MLAFLLACTSREREPAATQPTPETQSDAEPERPPLVTIELGLIGEEAHALLTERHGPDSPLVRADNLLIVHHRIAAPWHIYWTNPGESGLRTKLSLDVTGAEIGPVVYPAPERFTAMGGQVSYGWEREAVLFVPLTNISGEPVIKVRSDWLACHESCIPGHSEATGELSNLVRRDEPIVRDMVARIPEPAGDRLRTSWTGTKLRVESTVADAKLLEFFPYASDKAIVVDTALGEDALEVNYRFDGPPPAELGQGVITFGSAADTRWLELATPWPSP
jgi:thiol:disulfide interchange protein DsbD